MTPYEELEKRLKKLQAALQANDLSGALLVQRADLFYFSGTAQNAQLYVPAEGDPILMVKKSLARAREESALERILPFEGWDKLISLIKAKTPPGTKIGLECDVLPANLYFRYQKMLADYCISDLSKQIRQIRAVKSPYELGLMKNAARVGEAVFNHALEVIKPGMQEVDLAGRLEYHARTLGHQGAVRMRGFNQELYFGHILSGDNAAAISFFDGPTGGSGLNPSYPQGAGAKVIQRHEPILVDFVSVLDGYMVDQTRIFCIGEPPLHLHEAYRQAVLIKETLSRLGKAGCDGSSLYARAEKMVAQAGLTNHFMGYVEKVNFVGHGVGLELDELPVIAAGFKQPLEEGMVFALEPKFIFPGEGTVGIEDTFAVGKKGLQQITTFSDDLQVL